MKALGIATADDLARAARYRGIADRLLFDAKPAPGAVLPGGNGHAFDWSLLAGAGRDDPFMLSGGLTPDTVADAVAITAARRSTCRRASSRAPAARTRAHRRLRVGRQSRRRHERVRRAGRRGCDRTGNCPCGAKGVSPADTVLSRIPPEAELPP